MILELPPPPSRGPFAAAVFAVAYRSGQPRLNLAFSLMTIINRVLAGEILMDMRSSTASSFS
jgi:hypothetical protein